MRPFRHSTPRGPTGMPPYTEDDYFQAEPASAAGHPIQEGAGAVRLVDHAGRCGRASIGSLLWLRRSV